MNLSDIYSLDYNSQSIMSMTEVPVTDQTLDMSPMDLFDSIFWGKFCHAFTQLDLTNLDQYPMNNLDQLGFDYSQQLYTGF